MNLEVTCASSIDEFIIGELSARGELDDDPFIVNNLSETQARVDLWRESFPKIRPFFALKAQNNPATRRLLVQNGVGFDVASLQEMKDALGAGAAPEDLIFAQPYKQGSHLKFALERGIPSTCDCVDEIVKVGEMARGLGLPKPTILIRILPHHQDSYKVDSFASKYGAPLHRLQDLLDVAEGSGVRIRGISFHVGSNCHFSEPYTETLRLARCWWDRLGGYLDTLDIGGGFPGEGGDLFIKMAKEINQSLDEHFGDIKEQITVIAEPGRFIATPSVTVVTKVITKKDLEQFVLNTGKYGGLIAHWLYARGSKPYVIKQGASAKNDKKEANGEAGSNVQFWGPSCDSRDCLPDTYNFTESINRGDWIVFPNLGAYTCNLMCTFNGFNIPPIHYIR